MLLIFLLIILRITYLQYKKRKNRIQVENLDRNQRLVVKDEESPQNFSFGKAELSKPTLNNSQTKTMPMDSSGIAINIKNTKSQTNVERIAKRDESLNSPRISLTPNQPDLNIEHNKKKKNDLRDGPENGPKFESVIEWKSREMQDASEQQKAQELEALSCQKKDKDAIISDPFTIRSASKNNNLETENTEKHEIRTNVFPKNIQNHIENFDLTTLKREITQLTNATQLTSATIQSTGSRLRSRRKSIDRPHIKVLDNVSAISLDEFWQK